MIWQVVVLLVLVQSTMQQPIKTEIDTNIHSDNEDIEEIEKHKIQTMAKRSIIQDETENLLIIKSVYGEEEDDLELAETHVFRPLFSFKQQSLKEQYLKPKHKKYHKVFANPNLIDNNDDKN